MQQAGVSRAPRRGGSASTRIFRARDITDSIIINGDNNQVYLNREGNAIVDRLAANQRPKVRRLASPRIIGRPTRSIGLLDREAEITAVQGGLQPGNSIEFYCQEGFGKTTLERYMASQAQMPDGMVFIDQRVSLDDLLQELFEAFFHSDQLYKPRQVEYKQRFLNIQALILVDNYSLTREETQVLLDTLPKCAFVLASSERHLWDEGKAIHLVGLPLNAAMALFQGRIDRPLTEREIPVAESICSALQGHPLGIIQAAALVYQDGKSVKDVVLEIRGSDPHGRLLEYAVAPLSEGAESLLALLATFRNASLPVERMKELLPNTQLAAGLQNLLDRGLVQAHSPRYSLAGDLGVYLSRAWDLSQWNETALRYFVNWSSHPVSTEQVLDTSEAVIATMENAAAAKRWREVVQIGVAIEPGLVIGRRWGLWERLLKLVLRAGQALGDRAIEAWVFHQLGSRALCLGNLQEAGGFLSRALQMRREIGDKLGASATQHNLGQLPGGAPPRNPPSSKGGSPSGRGWIIPLSTVLIVSTLLIIGVIARGTQPQIPVPPPGQVDTLGPLLTSAYTPVPTIGPAVVASDTPSPTTISSDTPTPTYTASTTPTPSITVTLSPIPGPNQSITVDNATIDYGSCTVIRWVAEYASHVYLDGVEVAPNGNKEVCPSVNTTYTLQADPLYGSTYDYTSRSVAVSVIPPSPPQASLTVDNPIITAGDRTVVRWSVANASRAYLNGVEVAGNGQKVISPEVDATYTLYVEPWPGSTVGGTSRSVTVTVRPVFTIITFIPTLVPWTPPVTCTPAPPPSKGVYYYPAIDCYRVDWCYYAADKCGQAAADAFCEKVYDPASAALTFVQDPGVGKTGIKTIILGTGGICSADYCDSFQRIRCGIP